MKLFFIFFREGFINLFAAKLRSLLAVLGILAGTASVVAMVSGGELATREALKQFHLLGTDLMAVTLNESSQTSATKNSTKELKQIPAIKVQTADPAILLAAPYTILFENIQFHGQKISAPVLGITNNFTEILQLQAEQGRFISDLDQNNSFCILGHAVAEKIRTTTLQNPIGQQIQLGEHVFTVIGIAAPAAENAFIYVTIDDAILTTISSSMLLDEGISISNILLKLSAKNDINTIQNHIKNYFAKVAPNKKLFIRSARELIQKQKHQSQILTLFLGLIGGISLLIGGIGVMNIMLVSVLERRREIGIRLALGATPASIRQLFLVESLLLSLAGGIPGVIIGILITRILAFFWHWEFTLFIMPPIIGFTVSAAVGILAGFYPAYRAAQLNPVAALRAE